MGAGELKHIKSSIPGTVVKVCVAEGQAVKVGDLLIVFKAMKMNNNIKATFAGKVKKDRREGRRQYSESRADDRNGIGFRNLLFREATNGCLPVLLAGQRQAIA